MLLNTCTNDQLGLSLKRRSVQEKELHQLVIWVLFQVLLACQMGVSENSVPLNPMVNDHYPY